MTPGGTEPDSATPMAGVTWRRRVRVHGRVRSVRVRPRGDVPTFEAVLVDGTGGITLVFLGRRRVAGIALGTTLSAEGMAGDHQGRLAMLNPEYVLDPPPGR